MKKINREELSFANGAFKKAFKTIVILILIATLAIVMTSCKKEVHMKVTIIDHVVTADKQGYRTYSTIVRAEDGMIEEKTGLGFYVIPKGTEVLTTVYRQKK